MNPRVTINNIPNNVPEPHPCSININTITNFNEDYEELCNCCQRHVCRSTGYCKSKNKQGCRFGYPFKIEEKSRIVFNETEKNVRAEILLKRNDEFMNVHNRVN